MRTSTRPLGGTTITAAILHFVVCGLATGAIAVVGGIVMLFSGWASNPEDQGELLLLGAGIVVLAIVSLGFGVLCGFQMLARQAWARWAACGIQLAIFTLLGLLVRAQAGPLAMFAMFLPFAVAVLLLHPRTASDFEHAS